MNEPLYVDVVALHNAAIDRINKLELTLSAIEFQCETVANLETCGEVKFLRGVARLARVALDTK